ncbi:MAG: hypothetical protein DDT32_02305 [Syntrophomonadaceae bacterium]|nr:hypothetical protein [Bacillota bacterium]
MRISSIRVGEGRGLERGDQDNIFISIGGQDIAWLIGMNVHPFPGFIIHIITYSISLTIRII